MSQTTYTAEQRKRAQEMAEKKRREAQQKRLKAIADALRRNSDRRKQMQG